MSISEVSAGWEVYKVLGVYLYMYGSLCFGLEYIDDILFFYSRPLVDAC